MAVLTVKPLVTATAYETKDQVGPLMELKLGDIYRSCRCMLESITLTDLANQNSIDYWFLFFNRKPSNGTYADEAALDVDDTDMQYCIGAVMVDASAVACALADSCVMTTSGISLPLEAATVASASADSEKFSIWCLVMCVGTPTYAATTDVTLKFGFIESD